MLIYLQVGQNQPGFIGVIQRAMSRAEKHVWFERGEAKDRSAVARRYILVHFSTFSTRHLQHLKVGPIYVNLNKYV